MKESKIDKNIDAYIRENYSARRNMANALEQLLHIDEMGEDKV